MPPSRAIAIAIRASVTVSMGEDTTGTFKVMLFVSFVVRITSFGSTSDLPGCNKTSSNVNASTNLSSAGRSVMMVKTYLTYSLYRHGNFEIFYQITPQNSTHSRQNLAEPT